MRLSHFLFFFLNESSLSVNNYKVMRIKWVVFKWWWRWMMKKKRLRVFREVKRRMISWWWCCWLFQLMRMMKWWKMKTKDEKMFTLTEKQLISIITIEHWSVSVILSPGMTKWWRWWWRWRWGNRRWFCWFTLFHIFIIIIQHHYYHHIICIKVYVTM